MIIILFVTFNCDTLIIVISITLSVTFGCDQTDNFGAFSQSFDGTWAGTGPTGSFTEKGTGGGLDWYQFALSTYLSGVHLPPAPKPTTSAIHYRYNTNKYRIELLENVYILLYNFIEDCLP